MNKRFELEEPVLKVKHNFYNWLDGTLDHNSCIFVHDSFILDDVRVNSNKLIS